MRQRKRPPRTRACTPTGCLLPEAARARAGTLRTLRNGQLWIAEQIFSKVPEETHHDPKLTKKRLQLKSTGLSVVHLFRASAFEPAYCTPATLR